MPMNMLKYSILRSDRKSMVIEIRQSSEILVRVPRHVSDTQADRFVMKNQEKILMNLQKLKKRPQAVPLTQSQVAALQQKALEILPQKVAYFSRMLNVVPRHVKITSAQKRFGSCSASHGLCFSYLLMQYPDAAIDYVVLHEMAHIIHHNHSRQFYDLIAQHMPDYQQRSSLLKRISDENLFETASIGS